VTVGDTSFQIRRTWQEFIGLEKMLQHKFIRSKIPLLSTRKLPSARDTGALHARRLELNRWLEELLLMSEVRSAEELLSFLADDGRGSVNQAKSAVSFMLDPVSWSAPQVREFAVCVCVCVCGGRGNGCVCRC
jgi:hypothetical protein